jgi:hypothetical protein
MVETAPTTVEGQTTLPPVTHVRRTVTNQPRSRRDRGNHPTIELVDATADDAPLAAVTEARAAYQAAAEARAADGPLRFASPPTYGMERLKINYRQVRVSDEPSIGDSRELGRLDRGDEVEVIGSYEGYLQVRTPDGLIGWITRQAIV